MKKLISLILSLLCLTSLCLVGCDNSKTETPICECEKPVTLEDLEIGHEFSVYPTYEFDYELENGKVVHINKISAKLSEKNTIEQGSKISGEFERYAMTITVDAITTPELAGQNIYVEVLVSTYITSVKGQVQQDGTIVFENRTAYLRNIPNLVFSEITTY